MRKKGQLDYPLITFIGILLALLILAPVMLKIFTSIKTPVSSALGNVTGAGAIAQTNFNRVIDTGVNMWDKVIVAAFFLAVLLLFVSAFFIDANPFFIIIYIFLNFMLMLFAPNIIDSLDNIYNSSDFATEVSYLSFMNFVRVHFGEFLVGVMVVTGIIIYGKVALFGGGRR